MPDPRMSAEMIRQEFTAINNRISDNSINIRNNYNTVNLFMKEVKDALEMFDERLASIEEALDSMETDHEHARASRP